MTRALGRLTVPKVGVPVVRAVAPSSVVVTVPLATERRKDDAPKVAAFAAEFR
jgi:hypothetical protein